MGVGTDRIDESVAQRDDRVRPAARLACTGLHLGSVRDQLEFERQSGCHRLEHHACAAVFIMVHHEPLPADERLCCTAATLLATPVGWCKADADPPLEMRHTHSVHTCGADRTRWLIDCSAQARSTNFAGVRLPDRELPYVSGPCSATTSKGCELGSAAARLGARQPARGTFKSDSEACIGRQEACFAKISVIQARELRPPRAGCLISDPQRRSAAKISGFIRNLGPRCSITWCILAAVLCAATSVASRSLFGQPLTGVSGLAAPCDSLIHLE